MPADPFKHLAASIHDAALEPQSWPAVLQMLSEALGVAGAAAIVRNNRTGIIEWASFCGPSTEFKAHYVDHYSTLDPFPDLLTVNGPGWMRLSERIPAADLRRNEWYNDFVLRCGVGDIVAAQVTRTASRSVVLGIHHAVGQSPIDRRRAAHLDQPLEPLGRAAHVQLRLRELGWKSAIAVRALDQLSAGVIVCDGKGSVVEMNGLAELVVRRGDGLVVRHGKLGAGRVFENTKLAASIAAATSSQAGATSSRILVGRNGGGGYLLTVTPLGVDLGFYNEPLALVLSWTPSSDRRRRVTSRTISGCRPQRAGSRGNSCTAGSCTTFRRVRTSPSRRCEPS